MADIRLKEKFSLEAVTMDWLLLDDGRLDESQELATAVRVALGTDALADYDDVLPDPDSSDRRGWWGDYQAEEIWNGWPIGTKNWLLSRAKISDAISEEGDTLERARLYTLNALQPFLDQKIASRIDAEAVRTDRDRIEVNVKIYRFNHAEEIYLQYQLLWNEIKELEEFTSVRSPDVTIAYPSWSITVPTKTLLLSRFAPSVSITGPVSVSPPAVNIVLSTTAPTAIVSGNDINRDPPVADLALSTTAPTVATTQNIYSNPVVDDAVLSTTAPTVVVTNHLYANPPSADLAFSTTAPLVNGSISKQPPAANLTISGSVPGVVTGEDDDWAAWIAAT